MIKKFSAVLVVLIFCMSIGVLLSAEDLPLDTPEHNKYQDDRISSLEVRVNGMYDRINAPKDWSNMVYFGLFLLSQTGAALWWASKMTSKVDYLVERLEEEFKDKHNAHTDFENRLRKLEYNQSKRLRIDNYGDTGSGD